MSGLLIDVTKHLSNLKYRVWETMLDHIDYSEYTKLLSLLVEKPEVHILPLTCWKASF